MGNEGVGPLGGRRIVELGGIGPAPFAGMMFADLGADVIRIERPGPRDLADGAHRILHRGRRSLALDLRHPSAQEIVLDLARGADAVFEGFRPGVTERLGIGPADCLAVNPRLAYGRVTGWGADGPLSMTAGHDIDYIAVAGALREFGSAGDPPPPPLNLLGDFGGGGMLLVVGVLAAIAHSDKTGEGQVVDAAIVDGVASMLGMTLAMTAMGRWNADRGTNRFDGSVPFYATYECADGEFVAVGALEKPFYEALLSGLELEDLPSRDDAANHPAIQQAFSQRFSERTRDEWVDVFDGLDACVAPVLTPREAASGPLKSRETFTMADGILQPNVAPRFSGTPGRIGDSTYLRGEHTREILREVGYDDRRVDSLIASGTLEESVPLALR